MKNCLNDSSVNIAWKILCLKLLTLLNCNFKGGDTFMSKVSCSFLMLP